MCPCCSNKVSSQVVDTNHNPPVPRENNFIHKETPISTNHPPEKSPLEMEDSSALLIQSYWRGYIARKEYQIIREFSEISVEEHEKLVQLENDLDFFVSSHNLKQESEAALKIQRFWRNQKEKTKESPLFPIDKDKKKDDPSLEEKSSDNQREHLAAVTIQRLWKQNKEAVVKKNKEDKSAKVIQKHWRQHKQNSVQRNQERKSALVIQRHWKKNKGDIIQRKKENNSALIIQKQWRKNKQRVIQRNQEIQSAFIIQHFWKTNKTKILDSKKAKQDKEKEKEERAALCIQRNWKSYQIYMNRPNFSLINDEDMDIHEFSSDIDDIPDSVGVKSRSSSRYHKKKKENVTGQGKILPKKLFPMPKPPQKTKHTQKNLKPQSRVPSLFERYRANVKNINNVNNNNNNNFPMDFASVARFAMYTKKIVKRTRSNILTAEQEKKILQRRANSKKEKLVAQKLSNTATLYLPSEHTIEKTVVVSKNVFVRTSSFSKLPPNTIFVKKDSNLETKLFNKFKEKKKKEEERLNPSHDADNQLNVPPDNNDDFFLKNKRVDTPPPPTEDDLIVSDLEDSPDDVSCRTPW